MKKLTETATLALITNTIEEMKGLNIITINLKNKTNIADYVIIASATSNRHAISIAEKLLYTLKKSGFKKSRVEGLTYGDWIAIDLEGIIVHIFKQEVREYYNIENIW